MQLPDYEFLPAPLWILTLLHLVTLTLHFVAMNVLLGGLLISLFASIGNRWSSPVVAKFVKLFPSVMAATITLGVAPLLFLQLVYPKQVYSAAIASGWFWMLIVAAAMLAYYLFYAASFGTGKPGTRLALGVALVGILYISLTYSTVFSMVEDPGLIASVYKGDQSGLAFNPDVESWIFRWGHMILGALTVGGFFAGVLGRDDESWFTLGNHVFLGGMIGSSIFGLLWLFSLGDSLVGLMRSAGGWYLTISIVLAVVSVILFYRRSLLASGGMLFLSIFGMVATRHELRLVRLGEALAMPPVRPQWDVFGIFLVCFLVAVALIVWMLRLFVRPQPV